MLFEVYACAGRKDHPDKCCYGGYNYKQGQWMHTVARLEGNTLQITTDGHGERSRYYLHLELGRNHRKHANFGC